MGKKNVFTENLSLSLSVIHSDCQMRQSVPMKNRYAYLFMLFCIISTHPDAMAQMPSGRVLINEYLPWPMNSCGTESEMVELYNMGPGPVNIGCYILTDGDFSVTIPQGTVLQPGKFYVISGQSFIPAPCANISTGIQADLNWNICGCTNAPIPNTTPGFFTDGGYANEQVVLMDPNGRVVDAVVRALPVESSSGLNSMTTGTCSPVSFDLDDMPISYETLGESAGRGNSIARRLDGDCGWMKDTQQSGGATNNTPGKISSFKLSMYITEELSCTSGSARFLVDQAPAEDWFPLDYILGYDADGDGMFTQNDTYTSGTDSTAPELIIGNLPYGYYSINIGPRQGCSFQNFVFAIGPCGLLGFSVRAFQVNISNGFKMFAEINGADRLSGVILEGSKDGINFSKWDDVRFSSSPGSQEIRYNSPSTKFTYLRLALFNTEGKTVYSPIRKLSTGSRPDIVRLARNPVSDEIILYSFSPVGKLLEIKVCNTAGQTVQEDKYKISPGTSVIRIPASHLNQGSYIIKAYPGNAGPQTLRVIKQ